LNPSKLAWPIFQLALKCLKDKIRQRVQIHYGLESLHNSLDKQLLPESLGGDLSEEEASERHVIDMLLQENPPFERETFLYRCCLINILLVFPDSYLIKLLFLSCSQNTGMEPMEKSDMKEDLVGNVPTM